MCLAYLGFHFRLLSLGIGHLSVCGTERCIVRTYCNESNVLVVVIFFSSWAAALVVFSGTSVVSSGAPNPLSHISRC